MTTAAMTEFLKRLRHDSDLAARLSAAVGDKDGDVALEVLRTFATANGFRVTPDDLQAVRAGLAGSPAEGELTEADLNAMTGGSFGGPSVARGLHIMFKGIGPSKGVAPIEGYTPEAAFRI